MKSLPLKITLCGLAIVAVPTLLVTSAWLDIGCDLEWMAECSSPVCLHPLHPLQDGGRLGDCNLSLAQIVVGYCEFILWLYVVPALGSFILTSKILNRRGGKSTLSVVLAVVVAILCWILAWGLWSLYLVVFK